MVLMAAKPVRYYTRFVFSCESFSGFAGEKLCRVSELCRIALKRLEPKCFLKLIK